MKVEHQQVGTVNVLTPVGALVDREAEGLLKPLLEQVRSPSPRVVVCLQDVPYMDSVALEGLLTATEELADRAMTLKLVAVPSTCREIFELTGMSGRFAFFADVSAAVRSFL